MVEGLIIGAKVDREIAIPVPGQTVRFRVDTEGGGRAWGLDTTKAEQGRAILVHRPSPRLLQAGSGKRVLGRDREEGKFAQETRAVLTLALFCLQYNSMSAKQAAITCTQKACTANSWIH